MRVNHVAIDLDFYVHTVENTTEYAAGLALDNISFGFAIVTENDTSITFNMKDFHVEDVEVTHCAFGNIRPISIKLRINTGLEVGIPIFNWWMNKNAMQLP